MMNTVLKINLDAVKKLCQKHHLKYLYAFGSVTDASFKSESDIDLLSEFDFGNFDVPKDSIEKIPFDSFIEFYQLKDGFEKLFGKEVDLIPLQKLRNLIFNSKVEESKMLLYGG